MQEPKLWHGLAFRNDRNLLSVFFSSYATCGLAIAERTRISRPGYAALQLYCQVELLEQSWLRKVTLRTLRQ